MRPTRGWLSLVLFVATVPTAAYAREVPFASLVEVATAVDATRLRAADIDRDGDLDLVGNTHTLVLWFERDPGAAGGYVEHVAYTYNGQVEIGHLEVVDLDGDADIDIVAYRVTDPDLDTTAFLDYLENDGSPALGAWTKRNVKEWPDLFDVPLQRATGLAMGDLDEDGDVDLIVGRFIWAAFIPPNTGQIEWLANDGSPANGGWNGHILRDWRGDQFFESLRVADFDADGDFDLAGTIRNIDLTEVREVHWWENDGTPADGEWSERSIELGLTASRQCLDDLDVGDIDRDGDLDVALGTPQNLFWWTNDGTPGNGVWTRHQIPPASQGSCSIHLADIDLDGDLDLASDESGQGWYENDGTPSGSWPFHLVEQIASDEVGAADLDGDGDLDLFGSNYQEFFWHENQTVHRSAWLRDEREVNAFVDEAYDVAVGDVDGDGDLDLVSAAEANDHVYWHRNDGTPGDDSSWNLSTLTSAVNGPRSVALGDLDRDGDLDAVVASYNDDTVSWLENDGTLAGWTKRVISGGAGGAHAVAVADLDGDGDLDVACAQYLDDEVSWYRNNGGSPPTFGAFFVDSLAYDGPIALAAGDLDNDGDLDLAVVAGLADTVVWYGNDGTPAVGEWARHRTDSGEADGPRDVALADLDRDGDLDTLVANYLSDDVLWYENDGTLAGWTARTINGTCGGARSVAPGDFDRDGDLDVLLACFDDDALWLARSNGSAVPGFASDLVTIGANGVRSAAAADLDRDGDLDGAAAQGFDDQIAWYENQGGQFRVVGTAIAADPLVNDAVQGVLRAVVSHRGRSGDGQMELSAVAVRLEEAPGEPLSAFQASSLIDFVRVYGDDGDGLFDPDVDPLLAGVSPAGIDGSGTVWVDLADGAASVALAALAQKTFFVALDLADPFQFAAPRTVVVTLATAGSSICEAEDRSHDIPLDLEWRADVSTATLDVLDVLFRDGFGTGDTSRWSVVFP